VVALGASYSLTNLIFSLLWAAFGFLTVGGIKRYLKSTDSPEYLITHRTKTRLEGLLVALKDESLVSVVDDVLSRLKTVESKFDMEGSVHFQPDEEQRARKIQDFHKLYDYKGTPQDDVMVARALCERANEDMYEHLESFKESTKGIFSGRLLGHRQTATPEHQEQQEQLEQQQQSEYDHDVEYDQDQGEGESEQGQPQDQGDEQEQDRVRDGTRQPRLELEMGQVQPLPRKSAANWREQQSNSRRQSQAPTSPLHTQVVTSLPSTRPPTTTGFDPQVTAANLRRLSQRGGFHIPSSEAGPGTTANAPSHPMLSVHPMAAVLSGISPPTASDLRREKR
jgi:hypothetical protein